VIARTLDVLLSWPNRGPVVVVIHPDDTRLFEDATRSVTGIDGVTTTFGGPTRQQSVLAGLKALAGTGTTQVMVHDAARPFIDHSLLDRIAAKLEAGDEAVLPALPVSDTLKRAAGGKVLETVPRSALHAAQTPQGFHLPTILAAHQRAAEIQKNDFTD